MTGIASREETVQTPKIVACSQPDPEKKKHQHCMLGCQYCSACMLLCFLLNSNAGTGFILRYWIW